MKNFEGIVTSVGMQNTVVVEVFRKTPHPMYRKLIKLSKKYKVDNSGFENIAVGSTVRIVETRPISKGKYFKMTEIIDFLGKNSRVSKSNQKRLEVTEEIEAKPVRTRKTVAKKTRKEAKNDTA